MIAQPHDTLRRVSPLSLQSHSPLPIAGQVQVFTCTHRNFFTAVMAQALRDAGQGTSVLVVQFCKGGIGQGPEHPVQLGQHLNWVRCRLPEAVNGFPPSAIAREAILELWTFTQDQVRLGTYGQVILDELSLAIAYGIVPVDEVLRVLKQRPQSTDVILTGPQMPAALLQAADQVTELRNCFGVAIARPVNAAQGQRLRPTPPSQPLAVHLAKPALKISAEAIAPPGQMWIPGIEA